MNLNKGIKDTRSWREIEDSIAGFTEAKKRGDVFEEFCAVYLRLIPEYKIKKVWIQGNLPGRIIKKLNLIGQKDQGIDLVAETDEGKIWAVQAKFRSDRKNQVPYRELSTFLAVSDKADYRLVISNTESLPPIVEKRSNFGEILVDRLDQLDKDFFERFRAYLEDKKVLPEKPFTPKEHQLKAIEVAVKHYDKNDRGQLIMACGTGKTLTSVWIAEKLQSKHILVLVPSLALMRQTVSVWARNYKTAPFNYLCVCSDESVIEDAKSDYAVGKLEELDIPVTTDAKQTRKSISAHSNMPFIVFSTYQSSDVLSKAVLGIASYAFDLTICDEAHRTAGMTQGLFNLVLDDKHIRSKKRLFMTATPRILSKHIMKRGIEEDVDLFSMSDERSYGKEFYRLSFGEAIQRKLLTDYKVIIAIVTDEEVLSLIKKKKSVRVESKKIIEKEAQSFAKQVAYLKATTEYGIKHTISYHSRVSFAQAFAEGEQSIGQINDFVQENDENVPSVSAFHVNGTMAASERSDILRDFIDRPYSVVTNARCLTEGVDIPSVDGVLFFDPKYKLTDIVQATGRAIRLSEGKKYGYLIVPVLMKAGEAIEESLESSDFGQVISVIKAMQSQDERLDEVIAKLRSSDGEIMGGTKGLLSNQKSLEEKLYEHIQYCDIPKTISAQAFISKIRTYILPMLGSSWDYMFGLLKAFRKRYPKRWPTAKLNYKGINIGAWCDARRAQYKRNQLDISYVKLLDDIGFIWNPLEDAWNKNYNCLKKFRSKYPNKWPASTLNFEGVNIGAWCRNQRTGFTNNELDKRHLKLLEDIGFIWNSLDDAWNKNYNCLKMFRSKYPNRWPAHGFNYNGINIGTWCSKQRARFTKNQLEKKRVKLLNDIGFIWDPSEDAWNTAYNCLKKFRSKYPNKWPKQKLNYDGINIGAWCTAQRVQYKRSQLDITCVKLLDDIGFIWNPLEDAWNKYFNCLKKFRNIYPNRWPECGLIYQGMNIGAWCRNQRTEFTNHTLDKRRLKLLEDIGFIWNQLEDTWNTNYNCLKKFRSKYPNRWPAHNIIYEGIKIGAWCSKQRTRFAKNQLERKRIKLLNDIGFI
jgi:superfamily II DNA or RNA helicase/uncharacterized protein YjiS (DUF1127 family)